MNSIRVREDRSMHCYQTFSIFDGGRQIGALQCKGVCFGVTRELNHRHGPWITFVGPNNSDARNFGSLVDEFDEAVQRVVERHNETLHGST